MTLKELLEFLTTELPKEEGKSLDYLANKPVVFYTSPSEKLYLLSGYLSQDKKEICIDLGD